MMVALGQYIRFYGCTWAEMLAMRVNAWQALYDAIPQIDHADMLREIHILTLAGQRSVSDKDFKATMRKLQAKFKQTTSLPPDELQKWRKKVDKVNKQWEEIAAFSGV